MCDHFARELIKVVVVQICQDEGFQGIQASALEALTDLMIKCTTPLTLPLALPTLRT